MFLLYTHLDYQTSFSRTTDLMSILEDLNLKCFCGFVLNFNHFPPWSSIQLDQNCQELQLALACLTVPFHASGIPASFFQKVLNL